MAINSFDKQCDKIPLKHSSNHSKATLPSCHLLKLSITTDGSITSSDGKSSKTKKTRNATSPYLMGDSVQLLSRVTEKKLYAQHKKATEFVSSFPLAASIYRANSDEFKSQKKGNKKVKKSVLTLPNEPTESPQACTVSDTNDSKYIERRDDNRNLKPIKRTLQNRKSRVRNKDYEFYDRDARYCSQMNISLDCSSTDMVNQFTGDGNRVTRKFRTRKEPPDERKFNAHDVWTVLRNINRFQFRPSPPMSEDSIQTTNRKKIRNKKKSSRKDTRVIETCRTEEFAYISSYDVDSKSPLSFSQSSSFDRITVIDKQDEFSEICKEFENSIMKTNNTNQRKNRPPNRIQNKKNTKAYHKKNIVYKESDDRTEPKNNIQRDLSKSPVNTCKYKKNDDDGLETLVAVDYLNPQKRHETNTNKVVESKDFHEIVNRSKSSNGTLHSGSSKAAVTTSAHLQEDYPNKVMKLRSDLNHQVNGITKVILSKGDNIMLPKPINEIHNRKTRLETTLPRATIMPKLTQTEIKRQLANMKFPIVILGKDQLSSKSIQVMNYEPPHLLGFDQQIWPFMQDWYSDCTTKIVNQTENKNKVKEKPNEQMSSKTKQFSLDRKNLRRQMETATNKQASKQDKILNEDLAHNKKKYHKRSVPPLEISKINPQPSKKPKTMHQLKDKMLKLLYKNTSVKDVDDQCKNSSNDDSTNSYLPSVEVKPNGSNKVDVGIGTFVNYESVSQSLSRNPNLCPRFEVKQLPEVPKQPWAKAKWASDFIETVMKRIRNGIYYNQEYKNKLKCLNTGAKEVSVQTILTGNHLDANVMIMKDEIIQNTSNETLPSMTSNNTNDLKALPGFDETLPVLEIKTLNSKEVAVKHCTTNVMVQFDIAVPSEPEEMNSLQKSSSFVPLTVTESQTKIFKCKTTIINAMLPAEICSLLPKIILNIMNSNKPPALSSSESYQTECHLYTISELSNSESQDIFKPALPVITNLAPKLLALLDGAFLCKVVEPKTINQLPKLNYNDFNKTKNMLQTLSTRKLIPLFVSPLSLLHEAGKKYDDASKKYYPNGSILRSIEEHQSNGLVVNTCTALELYKGENTNFAIDTVFGTSDYRIDGNTSIRKLNVIPLLLNVDDHKVITRIRKYCCGFQNNSSIFVSNFNFKSLFKDFQGYNSENGLSNKIIGAIEYNTNTETKKQNSQVLNVANNSKVRKNKFIKLYKKCKSTSNISGEKNGTSLSKIENLDDFLQALGTGKILSSIFDGLSEKKIISSLLEMKNWITELSQRQAMLILLLINKKDTPNLVRFRPILLQGIAVNRITRASELDMEIEVIETENFNKFSKFESIPYISESVQNQDILLEELYWIAKTTASDYQKPFNESSEKLLKSLLEKRKKLNPSYLRVMARYVGLGLLKPLNHN